MEGPQIEEPAVIDLAEDDSNPADSADKVSNKLTCPLCNKQYVLLVRHLLKCGPKHEVSPTDLASIIEAVEIAARHSGLGKKIAPKAAKKPSQPRQRKPKEPSQTTSRITAGKKKKQITDSDSKPCAAESIAEDASASEGLKSKYLSQAQSDIKPASDHQSRRPFKPVTLKNGRLVAFKDLLVYEELIARISKIFSGTIPANQLPCEEQDFETIAISKASQISSARAFEASKFLSKETFTARGFCKYIFREDDRGSCS